VTIPMPSGGEKKKEEIPGNKKGEGGLPWLWGRRYFWNTERVRLQEKENTRSGKRKRYVAKKRSAAATN